MSTTLPWVICFTHGYEGYGTCPLCVATSLPEHAAPPGWKCCPFCYGSGMVQADDYRSCEPRFRLSFQNDQPEEAGA